MATLSTIRSVPQSSYQHKIASGNILIMPQRLNAMKSTVNLLLSHCQEYS